MKRLQIGIRDEEDAVSPVIGVILMVAITVILAAVIASFVIGLGDQNEPAPTPQFEVEQPESSVLTFSKDGGDDFDVDDVEMTAIVTLENTTSGNVTETEFDLDDINESESERQVRVYANTPPAQEIFEVKYDINNLPNGEMTAGDEFNFTFDEYASAGLTNPVGVNDVEITGWDVELVWAPEGQDSEIIYEDES